MNLGDAEAQLILAIVIALIGIIPTAALAVKTWLEVQTNKMAIGDRPTHEQVRQTVNDAVKTAIEENGHT